MRLSLKLAGITALVAVLALLVSDFLALRREMVLIEAARGREASELARGLARASELPAVAAPALVVAGIGRQVGDLELAWFDGPVPEAPAGRIGEDEHGHEVVEAIEPVVRDGRRVGAVIVRAPLAGRDDFARRFVARNVVTALLVTVLSLAGAFVFGHLLVGTRVEQLVRKADRIGRGDFDHPLDPQGGDEIAWLASSLNEMAVHLAEARREAAESSRAALEAEARLRHADRLTTVGQLAAGIAHELGTPLNVIAGRAALIAGRGADDRDVRDAGIIREQAERITGIVRRMLDFARVREPRRVRADLAALVRDAAELLDAMARKSGVRLDLDLPGDGAWGCFDPGALGQVITNLVVNAVQAQPDGGRVAVRVAAEGEGADRRLRLVVADEGPGMDAATAERVFDPFFTTKEPGEGTGLGLSVVHGIVAEHGGAVTVDSAPGRGAAFTVDFPAPCEEEA